jgi:hypothetical protein
MLLRFVSLTGDYADVRSAPQWPGGQFRERSVGQSAAGGGACAHQT